MSAAPHVYRRVSQFVRSAREHRRRWHQDTEAISSGNKGILLLGTLWAGGTDIPRPGYVQVDAAGVVRRMGDYQHEIRRRCEQDGVTIVGDLQSWIGPGICDAHVHIRDREQLPALLRAGVVGVRDLGSADTSPTTSGRSSAPARGSTPARGGTSGHTEHRHFGNAAPFVASSGPVLTAPGGYPFGARASAGTSGLPMRARVVHTQVTAAQTVRRAALEGVDVIKVMLDRRGNALPVLAPAVLKVVVDTAHSYGLSVVAHALRADMVSRAVDAGVDELAHVPTQRLSLELIERIADASISVVSTLQEFFSVGKGRDAALNAADLVRAGVRLRYGTDTGLVQPQRRLGVDVRELDRLASCGLGRLGALRAATEFSAHAAGMRTRTGLIRVGEPAALVMLCADPLVEIGAWAAPLAVLADGAVLLN